MDEYSKAQRAAAALRGVGLKSAVYCQDATVSMSADDAMKLLGLDDTDSATLLAFQHRLNGTIIQEAKGLMVALSRLLDLVRHSPDLCAKDEHVMSFSGLKGNCLACDHSVDV